MPSGVNTGVDHLSGRFTPNEDNCALEVAGKTHSHSHIADRIFKNQVPANDPRNQFAQCRITVRISTACDRDHRSQFGIAKPGKDASHGHQQERNRNRRAGRRPAIHHDVVKTSAVDQMHEQVKHLHLVKRGIAMLSGGSRACKSKNARSNDGANPQRGK